MKPSLPTPTAPQTLMKLILPLLLLVISSLTGAAQQFTQITSGLPALPRPSVTWADYDGDGDLDLLVAGEGSQNTIITKVYKNTAGVFTDSGIILNPLAVAGAAWGDFDNDGDLDLAMTGETSSGATQTYIYRNNGSTFAVVPGSFPGVAAGNLAWGDYDNDGDLDLLVTGITGSSATAALTSLYRNDGNGSFTSVAHPFPGIYLGAAAWGDYDNDGDLDLVISGTFPVTGVVSSSIWRNNGDGTFTDAGANLPGADIGFARWGDYDNDGDLDLLFGGNTNQGALTRIYRNDGGTFVDIGVNFIGLLWSSADWGDFDNDGDLDFILIGYDAATNTTQSRLYRNDPSGFVQTTDTFITADLGAVGWADYDNDGDLDLLIAGNGSNGLGDRLRIYRNNSAIHNTAPTSPVNLGANVQGTTAQLSWQPASDAQTPATALTYNLRVGTTPGGSQVVAPQSLSTGLGLLPAMGNAQLALSHGLRGLVPGTTYYWTVQSVDTAFKGSAFAAEGSFTATATLSVVTAVSRKTHGAAGDFDITLPLTGEPGVECRSGGSGGDHTLIVTFSNNIVSGNVSVTEGVGSLSGAPTFANNTLTINLTGVSDLQKLTLNLSGVTDANAVVLPDTGVSVNMLLGDTSGNKTVNASDVAQTKGQSGVTANSGNFRTDMNASGTVTASDVAQVKANAGHTVP